MNQRRGGGRKFGGQFRVLGGRLHKRMVFGSEMAQHMHVRTATECENMVDSDLANACRLWR